jgi:dUTP pyrophosphatase
MEIQIVKNEYFDDDSKLPKHATKRSTGFDIKAISDPEIVGTKTAKSDTLWDSIDYIQYRTGIFIATQDERKFGDMFTSSAVSYDVLVYPRSSVSKYNLTLANSVGLIDADYRGEILLRFKYNWQPMDFIYVPTADGNVTAISSRIVGKPNLDKIYKKGDAIGQLKITVNEPVKFKLVDQLDVTERNDGGFGSTDVRVTLPSVITDLYQKDNISPTPKKYIDLLKERDSK